MNSPQRDWLLSVVKRIPALFKGIEDGNMISRIVIGERVVDVKSARLFLVAEVVDSGRDPLTSHASVNYPATPNQVIPSDMITPAPRSRKRPKRW